jgi:hypothetical protein
MQISLAYPLNGIDHGSALATTRLAIHPSAQAGVVVLENEL